MAQAACPGSEIHDILSLMGHKSTELTVRMEFLDAAVLGLGLLV